MFGIENEILNLPHVPGRYALKHNLQKLSNILFNLTMFLLVLSFCCMLAPIFTGLIAMVIFFLLIISAVFSLGLLFLDPHYRGIWDMSFFSKVGEVSMNIAHAGKIILWVVVGVAALSLILHFFGNKKSAGKITGLIITIIFALLISIILVLGAK